MLFHSFAAFEHELNCIIFVYVVEPSRDNRKAILAALGGQNISAAGTTIKRILRVTKRREKLAIFSKIIQHVEQIQFFRNRLAHHLTVLTEEKFVFVNMNFAGVQEIEKIEDIYFDLSALVSAARDMALARSLVATLMSGEESTNVESKAKEIAWEFKSSMLYKISPIKSKEFSEEKIFEIFRKKRKDL